MQTEGFAEHTFFTHGAYAFSSASQLLVLWHAAIGSIAKQARSASYSEGHAASKSELLFWQFAAQPPMGSRPPHAAATAVQTVRQDDAALVVVVTVPVVVPPGMSTTTLPLHAAARSAVATAKQAEDRMVVIP